MKVITPGTRPENRIWHGVCVVCGAVVQAFARELKITPSDYRSEAFAWHKCPDCGAGDEKSGGVCFHILKE